MAKANRTARFSIFNPFQVFPFIPGSRFFYLGHAEVLRKKGKITKVLKEIKDRKRIDKIMINCTRYVNKRKKRRPFQKTSEQIQRGFDIAHRWMFDEPFWWFEDLIC